MADESRTNFGSKIGAILAAAGSAVGLGNVWRFPYETGQNGGAAFLIIYLLCVFLMGLPIMVSEFIIGRHSRSNTADAYLKLAPGTQWKWVGRLGVLSGFLILGFYSVVAGWTLDYLWQALMNGFSGKTSEQYTEMFTSFSGSTLSPIIWLIIFMLCTHFIIVMGVEKGIERYSKLLMPLLFILIVVLVVCSVTLPNASKGIEFLLKPDFSKVTASMLLSAMGQAFFSLSLGMGCLCTYASYFTKETRLVKSAFTIGIIDTTIAVMAGFIIFPAAFSVGINPGAGPGLVFITLPNVFQQAFSGAPVLAYIFSVMFYLLLALAALTSTISMHEVPTAYLHERFNISRRRAATLVTLGCMVIGIFSSTSFGLTKNFTLFGMGLFDFLDYLTAKIMLPLGGMLISIFTGWKLSKRVVLSELTNNGEIKTHVCRLMLYIVKYFAPVAIALVFLNELGLFRLLGLE
jgi:NSS family neurotransmitter:Na+ symporter